MPKKKDQVPEFRDGAIKAIYMENWMAYSGPVVLQAAPGVNIVAAANGCGKSAIVCAIALGLGFDLNVVSRGEKIRSFVKRGCQEATLRITLVDNKKPNGTITVQRNITLLSEPGRIKQSNKTQSKRSKKAEDQDVEDDEDYRDGPSDKKAGNPHGVKSDWQINGKLATFEAVKQLHATLNLQVNNLLTFLAQANVGKFASMNQQDLFRSTLKAIEPALCHDLERLIEMNNTLKSKQYDIKMLGNDLNSVTMKITQLQTISETFSKLKEASLYAYLVKYKLYKIKLKNLEKGRKANNTRMSWRSEELRRAEDEKTTLERKLETLSLELEQLYNDATGKLSEARKINVLSVNDRAARRGNQKQQLLADDNTLDRAFYDSITSLRAFSASQKAQQSGTKPSIISREVIERRLDAVNKQIELLKLQISGENELASEIAENRMIEESIKASLRKYQNATVRGHESIQVDNLLRRLNPITRNGYRQFLCWRRERMNRDPRGSGPAATSEQKEEEERRCLKVLPKLLISDLKVKGLTNCCIIEEAVNKYMDCIMIPRSNQVSQLSAIERFKIPYVTVPTTPVVLCQVTSTMRQFGVTHFLHELLTCSDEDTKLTLCTVARLGTAFVVDEEALNEWLRRQSSVSPDNEKDPDEQTEMELPTNHNGNTRSSSISDDSEHQNGKTDGNVNGTVTSTGTEHDHHLENLTNTGREDHDHSDTKENGDLSLSTSNEETTTRQTKRQRTAEDIGVSNENNPLSSSETKESTEQASKDDCHQRFYDCMIEEISKQLGRQVQILRYYVGTKRHIYRRFKDEKTFYSDYSMEIAAAPKILHDSSTLAEDAQGRIKKTEQELTEVTEKLKILGGMLYGRKQDNKVVGGRLYSLNKEKVSLERTLEAIEAPYGKGKSKSSRYEELEHLKRAQKAHMVEAIKERTETINRWIEKLSSRRLNLEAADHSHREYKKKLKRVSRLQELKKICEQTYEDVNEDVSRLRETISQQQEKHDEYSEELSTLSALIKAISGEIATDTEEINEAASSRVLKAIKVKQDAALKLENMGEGDLERELNLAELTVKQLERDDCEAKDTANEMKDEMLREQKLSKEIAEAEAAIGNIIDERTKLYDRWFSQVQSIISRVDANFGYFMRDIGEGSAGQVRVDASLEHIKDAKLRILVKFHGDRDLLPLAASYQSGGERGVSTMVYILAVQNLTTNPFFVIDEINQGLDSNYETRIMGLLLRHNSGKEDPEGQPGTIRALTEREHKRSPPPQYFVLTPQLLPNIDLKGATLHFPLNGVGVINGISI